MNSLLISNILCGLCDFRRIKAVNSEIQDEDEDVAMERQRVLSGNAANDVLKIENLTKVRDLENNTWFLAVLLKLSIHSKTAENHDYSHSYISCIKVLSFK